MPKHITSYTALAKKNWLKKVLEYVTEQGYTKAQIAEMLGISPQRLTNISNGTFAVSDKMMDTIVSTFGLGSIILSTDNFTAAEENSDMYSFDSKPLEEREGAVTRILSLLEEEGLTLEQFAKTVNASAAFFENAVRWPEDVKTLYLGNDSSVRGWILTFCNVFPQYSKFWILTGKTSKYNYPLERTAGKRKI